MQPDRSQEWSHVANQISDELENHYFMHKLRPPLWPLCALHSWAHTHDTQTLNPSSKHLKAHSHDNLFILWVGTCKKQAINRRWHMDFFTPLERRDEVNEHMGAHTWQSMPLSSLPLSNLREARGYKWSVRVCFWPWGNSIFYSIHALSSISRRFSLFLSVIQHHKPCLTSCSLWLENTLSGLFCLHCLKLKEATNATVYYVLFYWVK